MCSVSPALWWAPLVSSFVLAALCAVVAYLVSVRFVGRDRALRIALVVGVVGWIVFAFVASVFTGYLRC